jgi:hypothetical protein
MEASESKTGQPRQVIVFRSTPPALCCTSPRTSSGVPKDWVRQSSMPSSQVKQPNPYARLPIEQQHVERLRSLGRRTAVTNGYVSSGTGGHAGPLHQLRNRSVSSESVPARACKWTRVPHLSFPRNEGVPGSSPGVGSFLPRGQVLRSNIYSQARSRPSGDHVVNSELRLYVAREAGRESLPVCSPRFEMVETQKRATLSREDPADRALLSRNARPDPGSPAPLTLFPWWYSNLPCHRGRA